ncbi:C39 family peptidase [Bacillota bacterium Lsc_1132]
MPKKLASTSLIPRQTALQEKQPIISSSKILDVPLFNQLSAPRLYNGCEVTSLAMLLNYYGYKVTKNELAEDIKRVPLNLPGNKKGNPNIGFVGDMEDGPGLGVYNGPIFDLTKQYAGDKAVNLTGSSFDDLLKMVNREAPVWIITTTSFAPVSVFEKWNTPQGTIEITFSEHSVVITGYDDDSIYINDPYGYKNRKVDRDNFIKAWEQMGRQAVTIDV